MVNNDVAIEMLEKNKVVIEGQIKAVQGIVDDLMKQRSSLDNKERMRIDELRGLRAQVKGTDVAIGALRK